MIKHLIGRDPDVIRSKEPINLKQEWYYFKMKIKLFLMGKRVRDWMRWGTYGKDGTQPLKYVILKNMSDEHIEAILRTQFHIGPFYEKEFKKELKRRKKNPKLSVKETF